MNVPDEKIEEIARDVWGSQSQTGAEAILRRHLQEPRYDWSVCDEAFRRWWKPFPIKQKKIACKKIWRRLWKAKKLPSLLAMLTTLQQQVRSLQWQDGFGPHPKTYLNDGQWEDEVPAVAADPTNEEIRERRVKEYELARRVSALKEGPGEDELNRETMARLRSEIGLPAFG